MLWLYVFYKNVDCHVFNQLQPNIVSGEREYSQGVTLVVQDCSFVKTEAFKIVISYQHKAISTIMKLHFIQGFPKTRYYRDQSKFDIMVTLVPNSLVNQTQVFVLLTLSWRRPLSYRNQSIDLLRKSVDWFLYDNGLRHVRVKRAKNIVIHFNFC